MDTLTREVVAWLKDNGASLVGIANVERFDGAPKGHHPCDFVPESRSVVTFGLALLHQVLHWEEHLADSELIPPEHRKDVLQNYFYRQTGYVLVNNLLNIMALRVANLLESQGHLSLFFPATYGTGAILEYIKARIPSAKGLLSQRHAAVRAGLGEFGLNNVVVTPEYGPRIRFNSIITEAKLVPNQLIKKKVCLGEDCSICLQKCPGAISLRSDFNPRAVWYDTPVQTDIDYCINCWDKEYCWGRCIKVCPVGQKSGMHPVRTGLKDKL
jgi:epoxyqueuosine reductase QueG